MKVGISTACFYPEFLTEEAIECISKLGVEKIEVFLETYSEYSIEFAKKLKKEVDKHNISVYSVHVLSTQYEPQLFARTMRQRKDSEKIYERVLRGASILGAESYSFHGPPAMRTNINSIDYSKTAQIADRLASKALEYGVTLAWENVCWCWYSKPDFAHKLLAYSKSDNIGFTLDNKQAMKSGSDAFEYLAYMGKRLKNVHLSDYEGRLLKLPGRGEFDFSRLREELDAIGYDDMVILEVYRDNFKTLDDLKYSIDYLKDIFE